MLFPLTLCSIALAAAHPPINAKMHEAVSNLVSEIDTTHLTGKVMAKMTVELEEKKISAGERLVLRCELTTTPTAVFHWTLNGKVIQGDMDLNIYEKVINIGRPIVESGIVASTYTIPCASAQDAGKYTCVAYNGHLKVESSAEVIVEEDETAPSCKPSRRSPPTVTQWSESRFEMEGNTATLVCRADKKAHFTWMFDGEVIHTGGRYEKMPNGDLLVKNIKWADMGDYECIAANKYGEDRVTTFLYPTKKKTL